MARTSQDLFVVAEMITRTLTDHGPIDTDVAGWQARLPSDPVQALRGYLARFGNEQARVLAVLHPLARAHGGGLAIRADGAWLVAANLLRPDGVDTLDESDLRRVCEQAHDYIVTGPHGERRLYHDEIADTVRAIAQMSAEAPDVADVRFVDALLSLLPDDPDEPGVDAYADVDGYLLRHLPGHLADAGRTPSCCAQACCSRLIKRRCDVPWCSARWPSRAATKEYGSPSSMPSPARKRRRRSAPPLSVWHCAGRGDLTSSASSARSAARADASVRVHQRGTSASGAR